VEVSRTAHTRSPPHPGRQIRFSRPADSSPSLVSTQSVSSPRHPLLQSAPPPRRPRSQAPPQQARAETGSGSVSCGQRAARILISSSFDGDQRKVTGWELTSPPTSFPSWHLGWMHRGSRRSPRGAGYGKKISPFGRGGGDFVRSGTGMGVQHPWEFSFLLPGTVSPPTARGFCGA
jgi:hypothetical protein